VLAILWASWAEIDQVSSGEGRVIPSGHVQVVQNLEGGILSELNVREGDRVENGQVLMQLDATQFSSDFMENRLKYLGLQAVVSRLQAEIAGTDLKFPAPVEQQLPAVAQAERALFASRTREEAATLAKLEAQYQQKVHDVEESRARIAQLQTVIKLAHQEMDILAPLVAKGINAPIELIRLKREASQNEGDFEVAKQQILKLTASIEETRQAIAEARAQFRSRALKELNEAQVNMASLGQIVTSRDDRLRRTVIRAPVTGIVKQIFINTIGGVVRPGMDLMEIVPIEENLLVEAKIRPADIAFMYPGLEATVRFTAYDYTIYGSLQATLDQISADTIVDEEKKERFYMIRLRTKTNSLLDKTGKPLPIIPGMTVTVDVKTGRRTVLQYLLKPFHKLSVKAFHER
jgi:adhesin transport system membrane fusion protein